MQFSRMMKMLMAGMLAAPLIAVASDKDKKDSNGQMVDSGSLGVFMGGKRIATETFSIQQSSNGSLISSQFKTEEGTDKAAQTSELQLAPNGDIRKYEWKELSPGKGRPRSHPATIT